MMDLHYENDNYHPESKLFPPHNIAGTSGRQLYGTVGHISVQTPTISNVLIVLSRNKLSRGVP
jgi:hypothetical protein